MLFAIIGFDHEGAAEKRAANLKEHREHAATIREQFAFGGPLQSDDDGRSVGSLIVADFPDRKAVENWLFKDPLYKAGVYKSIEIRRFQNRWPQKTGFVEA